LIKLFNLDRLHMRYMGFIALLKRLTFWRG